MDTVYYLLEKILPFSWMNYEFMRNAFLAVLIITPLFGIIGTLIVNNRMAFFSDALGHSALTGVAVGMILGVTNTNLSMIIFAVIFALLLNKIKNMNTVSTDTIISVFASLSMALGLVILSKGGQFAQYSSLLVGDILSITQDEIVLLVIIFLAVSVFWCLCFNRLHVISLNKSLARSRNVNINLIDNIFVVMIAIIVMVSIKWVGILIINALLILPAASSRNLADNMREYHLFSVMIALFSGILGLLLSYYNSIATGPTIVMISAVIFFITLAAKSKVIR